MDGAGKAMKLNYSKAIDSAIEVVASGKATYTAEINNIVKQAVSEGTKVVYPSGYTRRLDSYVRMNLLDGVRGLRDTQAEMYAQEYGADGVEIDAHGMCAEDHQPYQGKQYAYGPNKAPKGYKHFDDLDLGRPIGEYNCTHSLSYIVLGVSDPVYSDKELRAMRDYSNAKVSFGGKSMTRYEASQYMRALETKMRDCKAVLIGGSNEAVKSQLNSTRALYNEVAKSANITPRPNRASVPGYKG